MSTYEPIADRDGSPVPTGAGDMPSRSAAVFGAKAEASAETEAGAEAGTGVGSGPGTRASGSEPPTGVALGVIPGTGAGTGAVPMGHAGANAEADLNTDAPDGGLMTVSPVEAGLDADAGSGVDADTERVGWRSRDLLLLAGTCLLILLLVNAFVARPFGVPSGSMENTLHPGDRLVANQLAYAFGGHVQRGDVVVFDGAGSFLPEAPEATGVGAALRGLGQRLGVAPTGDTVYVKRVIGVGGDRVTSPGPGGPITVNGVALDESAYLETGDESSTVAFDVVVPVGKLWVMGDHRRGSRDSRDHLGEPGGGFVPESKVIGRADWVVYPVGHWTSLDRPASFAALEGTGGHGHQG